MRKWDVKHRKEEEEGLAAWCCVECSVNYRRTLKNPSVARVIPWTGEAVSVGRISMTNTGRTSRGRRSYLHFIPADKWARVQCRLAALDARAYTYTRAFDGKSSLANIARVPAQRKKSRTIRVDRALARVRNRFGNQRASPRFFASLPLNRLNRKQRSCVSFAR